MSISCYTKFTWLRWFWKWLFKKNHAQE